MIKIIKFVAPRWKAVTAFLVTLIGALAQLFPNSTGLHTVFGFITMAAATVGVHAVKNAGVAPVQQVVDEVTKLVSPAAAVEVAQAVTATTTGVLKDATGAVGGLLGGVLSVIPADSDAQNPSGVSIDPVDSP